MKTKHFFTALLCTVTYLSFAQNVQSDALATSGGLNAGTTTSGAGGNTFYGYMAGKNNTIGSQNVMIGNGSGGSSTTGNNNVFIGTSAGSTNLLGNNNVYIGVNAGPDDGSNVSGNIFIGYNAGFEQTGNNKLIIGNNETNQLIWGDFTQDQLKFNAKVGVGYGFGNYPTMAGSVNISNYNLFVKGGILTEELRVSLTGTWADYVFNKDYNLPSLEEVENHIKEKGHLINVPSAKEVAENGLELGNIAKIQQEKIEELTLYIIEQNKINEKQNQEIEELKILVKQLVDKK
ncbi:MULTISPECIES: hypothetical protein [Flavobacterium]|uniref:TMF family protein n=1 Tax=Flavobacterium jumunjinense TaxID=998845 RepID=A0ABV5GMT7_9FLAO|nr:MULTISPECIES: hypothetical protein [Flavobacterium]